MVDARLRIGVGSSFTCVLAECFGNAQHSAAAPFLLQKRLERRHALLSFLNMSPDNGKGSLRIQASGRVEHI